MFQKTPLELWIQAKIDMEGGLLTREAIERYQLEKIRDAIVYARSHSRFYGEQLKDINPECIQSLADVRNLPFTDPPELAKQGMRMSCVSQAQIERIITLDSSGTTGAPKKVFFTKSDQELTVDFFYHGMRTFTTQGDRVLILMPGLREGSVGKLLKEAIERIEAVSLVYGVVDDVEKVERLIIDCGITGIVGIPQHVHALTLGMNASRIRAAGTLRNVLLSADYVPESIVRGVQERWGCAVFEHYGMTEMGFGGAVSCNAGHGIHYREADLFIEIVDLDSGVNVADGIWGEIVFTTLTRTGMPLIRYRTGDISRFIPQKCECGTVLKSLDRIRGRKNSDLQMDSGMIIRSAELDELIFGIYGVRDFQASIETENGCDRLTIVVNCEKAAFQRIASQITDSVKSTFRCSELPIEITGPYPSTPDLRGMQKRRIIRRKHCESAIFSRECMVGGTLQTNQRTFYL